VEKTAAGGDNVTELEHERRLTAVEDRAKSNSRRIDKLEETAQAIHHLATTMEVMVEKQERVADSVEKLDSKVSALEGKSGKRWDGLVDKAILVCVTGLLTWVLSRLGLGA